MSTRDELKQLIDQLDEQQLAVATQLFTECVTRTEGAKTEAATTPLWEREPSERIAYLRNWLDQLPKGSPSLAPEAISREDIYD